MTRTDRIIRWSTSAAVIGVAVVSYEHAYALVHAHGETGDGPDSSRSPSMGSSGRVPWSCSTQIEMGQGDHTGLARIVAEELDADAVGF
jgi:hypothetical protein